MENQYGITTANKYSLFLNEDLDPLEILKLQEQAKTSKKTEKSKKNAVAGNENDAKSAGGKQSTAASLVPERKSDKIDHFSSPVQNDDKPAQGRSSADKDGSSRPAKDKPRRADGAPHAGPGGSVDNQRTQRPPRNTDANAVNKTGDRPPRRERQERERVGGVERERRSDRDGEFTQQQSDKPGNDQAEHGGFERRDGFASRPQRFDRGGGGFRERGGRRGERSYRGGFNDRGGFVERTQRSGFDEQQQPERERGVYSDRPPRRGGYRGRRGGERSGFGERNERSGFNTAVEGQDLGTAPDQPQIHEESHQQQEGGGFGEHQERRGFEEQPERAGFEDRGGREFVRRGRGGGRGFGRGRGGGPGRPARREFDRHTEGGMRPGDKRDGAGSHNWGTVMDDIEGQQEKLVTEGSTWAEQADAEDRAAAAAAATVTGTDRDGEAGREEDEKVMTLDEWKSMEDSKRVKTEFNIRKPGEGCIDPKWNKMVPLTKKEKPEAHEEHHEDLDQLDDEDHHAKARNVLNIDIRFADNPRRGTGGSRGPGRGGRGTGRGGPRGGGGSDGYGGGREFQYRGGGHRSGGSGGHRERAPNVADEMDFPSLDKASGAAQA